MAELEPGKLLQYDFRRGHEPQPAKPVKLLQWNIERGYQLEAIIAQLKQVDADVIALQEVDVGCERSGSIDTGKRIAEALCMNYVYLCEFQELRSPIRDASSQGGGTHGNALLSRYDMVDIRVVEHRYHPVNWEDPAHPLARKEPRKGRRFILAAQVQCPQGPLIVYNLHLEVFCGMLGRIEQFTDVLRDSRQQLAKGFFHQAILGDLNTMAHGIARLSPNYCCDKMRLWSLGLYEAQFWDRCLLAVPDPAWLPERDGQISDGQMSPLPDEAAGTGDTRVKGSGVQAGGREGNAALAWWGVRAEVCAEALNPGFKDPFHPVNDITLDNPQYRFFGIPLMKGKLDWVLLRRLRVVATGIGNHSFVASDHKWLSTDVEFE